MKEAVKDIDDSIKQKNICVSLKKYVNEKNTYLFIQFSHNVRAMSSFAFLDVAVVVRLDRLLFIGFNFLPPPGVLEMVTEPMRLTSLD